MTRIQSYAGSDLTIVQPSIWKLAQELRDGETTLGTMTFKSFHRFEAQGVCDQGSWTFRRKGFWNASMIIEQSDTGIGVGAVPLPVFKRELEFELPQRRNEKLTLTQNLWGTEYILRGRMGRDILALRTKHFKPSSGTFTIGARAGDYEELPWLTFAVWYYAFVISRMHSHTP